MSRVKFGWIRFLPLAALVLWTIPARAHQLWIETDPAGKAGEEREIHVCWGHSGHKETGQALEGYQSKLTAQMLRPDGRTEVLNLAKDDDCFAAEINPAASGYYVLGADLQVGIIDQEFHGVPANTRIVMYGKSFTRVNGSEDGLSDRLGFDLEMVPLTDLRDLHPGDVVTAKVLLRGKAIGGRNVAVSLKALGTKPLSEDPRIQSREWSIEATANPKTGEVTFPLILGGQHMFYISYIDETPGTYNGDRNDSSEFSHLCKGDAYERTMYVSTLTVYVKSDK